MDWKNFLCLVILSSGFCSAETVEFLWKGKEADVPGSAGYQKKVVRSQVVPGKGTVVLARKGQKQTATIVLAANPTRSAQIAAAELNYYLEKMTGTRLPVVSEEVTPFQKPLVLIGESSLTRSLGLKNEDFQPQEYLIATYGFALVLMGYDEPEYGLIDYEGTGLWPGFTIYYDWSRKPEINKAVGSVYAVDEFLQRFCGVRWYLPGEFGQVYPEKNEVSVSNVYLRRKPWSKYRAIYPPGISTPFEFLGSGKKLQRLPEREVNLWYLRQKLVGAEAFNANHSLVADWFQQRFPEKKNLLAKGYERPTQLCLSEPELLKIVCGDADDYFSGRTNYERSCGDYFCVMPHDTSQYCQCSRCQEKLKKPQDAAGYGFWNDLAANYVWGFVNDVARYVKKNHPGRWTSCCAYARYSLVPDKVKLSDNVAVMVCRVLIDGIKDPAYKEFYRKQIKDWAKTVKRWYVWEYFDHLQGNNIEPPNFPGLFLQEIAEDINFLKENGCRGIFNELSSSPGGLHPNFALDHLNLYVQLQLLNDETISVEEVLDEYCRLFYGPAASPLKEFFTLLEKRFANPENWKLKENQTDANWDVICTASQLKIFENLLEKARNLATNEPYVTRVRWVREVIFSVMEKNSLRHATLQAERRKIFIPRITGEEQLLQGKTNHIEKFFSINGEPTSTRTEAWLGYDESFLYILVKCYEPQMESLVARVKPEDKDKMDICQDDAVEIFLDVGRTRKKYIQILANTNGATNDGLFQIGLPADFHYQTDTRCRLTKEKDFWSILFLIPWEKLTGGRVVAKGEIWGLNICRDRPRPGQDSQAIWTTWSPTGTNFHVPARFGLVEFQ